MATFIYPARTITIDTGDLATEATLELVKDAVESIDTKTTKVDTDDVTVTSSVLPTGAATEATLSALAAEDFATSAKQDSQTSLLTTIDADTGAIATSASSIDGKTPALVGGRVPVDGSGVTQPVSASSLPLPTGASTEATLSSLLAKTASSPVPDVFDNIVVTYVTVGNGIGEISTVLWKLSSTTVKTATFTYDANDKLSTVAWS